jgi:hypothetical protein
MFEIIGIGRLQIWIEPGLIGVSREWFCHSDTKNSITNRYTYHMKITNDIYVAHLVWFFIYIF